VGNHIQVQVPPSAPASRSPGEPASPTGFIAWAASHRVFFARIVSAVPDFGLAGFFALTWVTPLRFGTDIFARLAQIMLMEFIVVHSSAFLGFAAVGPERRLTRVLAVLGLGLLYTLFVGSFALLFHSAWPLISFWTLLLNRMLSIILGPKPQERDMDFVAIGWVTGFVCYLGFIFLTSLANLPHLGITAAVVATHPVPTGGIWADNPWRAAAFGTFYYAAMGVADLIGLGTPSADESRPRPRRKLSKRNR